MSNRYHLTSAASMSLAIAMLMPASLCAGDLIKIETKILSTGVTKLPHNIAEVANLKGVDILCPPSINTKFSNSGKLEILRDYIPPSCTNQKFESSSIGVTISVTPERQGEQIAFNACLTITELVGEVNLEHRTQSETVTRTIYFSGIQKMGEEGWFVLIDPPKGSTQKKISAWIRFEQPNIE